MLNPESLQNIRTAPSTPMKPPSVLAPDFVQREADQHAVAEKVAWRDRLGIALSVLCLIHCMLTPFMIGLLPMGTALGFWQHGFHQIFLFVVPFVALLAFIPGWRRHRDARVWYWALAGLALLGSGVGVAEMQGHDAEPNGFISNALLFELVLTAAGGACLIRAHLLNRKLSACCDHVH